MAGINGMMEESVNAAGKPVKVIVKEVFKVTSACAPCKKKKKKCDGKVPCASISLNINN